MKCRYAGEPLRIRALSIKEVLEPGELVLYEARFHKSIWKSRLRRTRWRRKASRYPC